MAVASTPPARPWPSALSSVNMPHFLGHSLFGMVSTMSNGTAAAMAGVKNMSATYW